MFWDTNIFIYLFENDGDLGLAARALRGRMLERRDELITSWMTLAEVQVQPRALGLTAKAEAFQRTILQSAQVISFDEVCSRAYIEVRLRSKAKGPDAIQFACAAAAGCDIFVTNDSDLTKMHILEIGIISTMADALR